MADSLIIFLAAYLYLIVAVLALVAFLRATPDDRLKLVAMGLVALPLAYILGVLGGLVISSPRPFVVGNVKPLIKSSTDNGFPSDHTLLSMTLAMLILAVNRKWGLLLIVLAAGVGAGRVLAHVHHPIDVIGSTVIAAIAVAIAYFLEPKVESLLRRLIRRVINSRPSVRNT